MKSTCAGAQSHIIKTQLNGPILWLHY